MKDLMVESDWHIVNKDTVNLQQSQDVRKQLDSILTEYEGHLKQKLSQMSQAIDWEQDY